ncbi:phage tail protein [Portibacter marinus]|uniref:phage tail protein n=1 Tax=Portibacter marinus TaxID=2898660 RepID=UPI001F39A87E|nr:phage tail protein [Portibacter marinus]
MASSAEDKFPVPKFHFTVDLGSGPIAFQEVTGLDMENDHMEYRSGDDPEFVTLKRAGLRKTGTVSFKKGVFTGDTDVWDNYKTIIDDKNYYSQSTPVDLTVTLLDESGGTVITWTIAKAVAIKMTNGDLKSEENAIAIEQIDFVHSGIIQA